MTREEIKSTFEVKGGRIVSPGRFESEPLYTPYFYDLFLHGLYDEETMGGNRIVFTITDQDRMEWPELKSTTKVILWFTVEGFIILIEEGI
jgi:hypothetical protein